MKKTTPSKSSKPTIDVLVTPQVITIVTGGHTTMIREGDALFSPVRAAVRRKDYDSIPSILMTPTTVAKFSFGKLSINNSQVTFKGRVLANAIVTRIREFIAEGLPYEPLAKFLAKLQENPSHTSVKELYEFLEHRHLPITQDGNFLAYKKVRDDFLDFYSGKVDNTPGSTPPPMSRNEVDDNRQNTCSEGYHVGSLKYADEEFHHGEGKIVIVEVNPADAVSVPSDHSAQKLRVCKYIVRHLYEGPLEQKKVVTKAKAPESKGSWVAEEPAAKPVTKYKRDPFLATLTKLHNSKKNPEKVIAFLAKSSKKGVAFIKARIAKIDVTHLSYGEKQLIETYLKS